MIIVGLIVFLAIFTQTLTGFGLALVSMPLLLLIMDIHIATPLVALVAVTSEIFLLARYRHHLSFQTVWRLSIASLIGIPLGVVALSRVDETIVLTALGIVITGYAIYALLELRLPPVEHPRWAYGFGFIAGLLSGAYNTSGPPVVIYGSCRRWELAAFKSNLQGFFLLNSTMVITSHALSHNFTSEVWQNYWVALPGIGLGLACGFFLDRYVNPEQFRKLVLGLLVFLGIWLIL